MLTARFVAYSLLDMGHTKVSEKGQTRHEKFIKDVAEEVQAPFLSEHREPVKKNKAPHCPRLIVNLNRGHLSIWHLHPRAPSASFWLNIWTWQGYHLGSMMDRVD